MHKTIACISCKLFDDYEKFCEGFIMKNYYKVLFFEELKKKTCLNYNILQ